METVWSILLNQSNNNNNTQSKRFKNNNNNIIGNGKANNKDDVWNDSCYMNEEEEDDDDPLSILTHKREWSNDDNDRQRLVQTHNHVHLVTWSSDNMIAFTMDDDNGCNKQNIYIVRVDLPHEYMVIKTSHQDTIKYLEWSNQTQGSLLMSSDQSDRVCLWKKKENIDEWECIQTFQFPYLLLSKWVTITPSYLPLQYPDHNSVQNNIGKDPLELQDGIPFTPLPNPPFHQYNIKPNNEIVTQTFIALSKEGKINIVTYSILEQSWKQITCTIELPNYYTIDCADVISTKDDNILIAIHSERLGNLILIYQLSFDIYTNYYNLFQDDKINLNDILENDNILTQMKRNFKVTSISFDNSTNAIIVMKKGIYSSILYRWEKKTNLQSQHQQIIKLLGDHKQIVEWICTNKRLITSSDPTTSTATTVSSTPATNQQQNGNNHQNNNGKSTLSTSQTIFEMNGNNNNDSNLKKRKTKDMNTISLHYVNVMGIIWLTFMDGVVEALNSTTLETISQTKLPHPDYAYSITSSPNGTLSAIVTKDSRLQLVALPCQSMDKETFTTWLNNLFQVSVLMSNDWWDLLIMLKIYSSAIPDNRDSFHHLIIKLSTDFSLHYGNYGGSLEASSTSFSSNSTTPSSTATSTTSRSNHQLHTNRGVIESIKSSIYRIVNDMEIPFIDSQAKLFIYYILDIMRSSYSALCCENQGSAEDRDNVGYFVDWVADFMNFLIKNSYALNPYFKNKDELTNYKIPPKYKDIESIHYYPHYYAELKTKPFIFPFISLYYDINILLAILEMGNYAKIYKEKCPSDNKMIKYKDIKSLADMYTTLVTQIAPHFAYGDQKTLDILQQFISNNYNSILNQQQQQLQQSNKDTLSIVSLPYFKTMDSSGLGPYTTAICTIFQNVIPSTITRDFNDALLTGYLNFLDLDPPIEGFLDQNQIKQGIFNQQQQLQQQQPITTPTSPRISSNIFKYSPKGAEYPSIIYDIVTRVPTPTKLEKPIKKCSRCHRMTVLRRSSLFWAERWSMACPICGGKWKNFKDNYFDQFQQQQQQQQ